MCCIGSMYVLDNLCDCAPVSPEMSDRYSGQALVLHFKGVVRDRNWKGSGDKRGDTPGRAFMLRP